MSGWRWLFGRPAESDLRREINAHIAERVDELIDDGVSEADAQAQARREFGNRTLPIEQSREVWIAPWLSSLGQDLHYALRSFTRQRGFTLSVVGVLALGIAPVTALFTFFNASVFKPWPVRVPSSLAIVKPVAGPREQYGTLSNLEYRYFRDHTRAFTHLATWTPAGGPIAYGTTSVDFIQSKYVSANYFDTLGVGMRLGRTFLTEEEDYGALGLGVGCTMMRVFALRQHSPMLANPDPYLPDLTVSAFALSMAFVACLASAVMPALRSTRVGIATRANEAAAARSGAGRWRTALLATQLAVSMVLLVGASLLTRAVSHALTVDPGFAIHALQAVSIRLPEGTPRPRQVALLRAIQVALDGQDLPPIAFSEFTAITGSQRLSSFRGSSDHGSAGSVMTTRDVSAAYFRVLGIPLLQGRTFVDGDGADEVVVNESAARLFWPDENALGKPLMTGSGAGSKTRAYTVVGVVKDVAVTSLSQLQPVVYQRLQSAGLLLVRDRSPAIADRIATIARGIEPNAKLTARPLADDIESATASVAMAGRLAWAISVFALILATAGAFGVFAYTVEERRREIGVRMALGAHTRQVVWLVVAGARRPLLFGLGAGLAMASIGAPIMRRFLYGLSPFDPIAYGGVFVILIGAAFLATWIPARRAAHIDPAVTLRAD